MSISAASLALPDAGHSHILLASSQAAFRLKILKDLGPAGMSVSEATGGADALMKLSESDYRTLLLDPLIEDLDVEELVATIRARHPELNVVVLEREVGQKQLSLDLTEVIPENIAPKNIEPIHPATDLTTEPWKYLPEVVPPGVGVAQRTIEALPGIIGTSRKMQQMYRLARLVAPRDTAVLIVGATGTGKELVARGVHELSRRSSGPFIVVNCAAIPESLLEAELFGFTRGAFTGAFQSRLGRIHAAHGGTLLLDEIGELPLSMQAKLLRFVQEGEVQRLGSADLFRVDARLIAATNVDLLRRVREKQFREDLYYRLAVFPISLPPLRDRAGDILSLAQHFLKALAIEANVSPKMFSAEAADVLQKYSWPGNVRELQHRIERAFVLSEMSEQIRAVDLAMILEAV